MPPVLLLAPVALLLMAGLANVVIGLAGWKISRLSAAAGPWAALAVLVAEWVAVRSPQELYVGALGYGANLELRLDAVAFAFGLLILVPTAILLTLQSRSWQESTAAVLGVAAAVLAVEAGGILLTALAGGTAATLAVLQLDTEDIKAKRPSWGMLLAAWLALAWAGVLLQVGGGTVSYGAVPESSLTAPVFTLLAVAALLASGLIPWFGWPYQLWLRRSLRGAGMVLATLHPLGFYLLVRAYAVGAGAYPNPVFNDALSVIGVAIALAGAVRSQAAPDRRAYFADVVPGLSGFGLMALGLGNPLGVVAAIVLLSAAALATASLALLPDRPTRLVPLIMVAAAVGAPPGLAFGARVLGLEATFEAGDLTGLIGVAGAAAWIIGAAAAARAMRLPPGTGLETGHPSSLPVLVLGLAMFVLGPALALLVNAIALPATNAVMSVAPGVLSGGSTSVDTDSTAVPAVALFAPLLVLAAVGAFIAGRPSGPAREAVPPPLFRLPSTTLVSEGRPARSISIPDQYRSLVDLRSLEAAAARGRPLFWLAVVAALVIAVNR